jgi:hypothetical protein
MRCPHCQPENRGGSRCCAACGTSCASKCLACGRQPLPGSAFCNSRGLPNRNDDGCRTCPAGTSTLDVPGIHPQASHRGDPGLLCHPVGAHEQGAGLFTSVKTSTERLADRDLREARHPVAPVLGHAVEKLQAHAALPQWPAHLGGGGLVIEHARPRSWGGHTGMPHIALAHPHGNARQWVHLDGKMQSRMTGWRWSSVRLGSGGSMFNMRCLQTELRFPWRADAPREWSLARPKFRWKHRLA